MSDSAAEPVILALASGKGGVGKTMIAVACAYELSLAVPTLLIDLDFFNRGLSGLLSQRREIGLVARPRYLDALDAPPVAPWRVVEVESNLFYIAYPDLVPDEIVRLEGRSAADIASELRDFIKNASALCGARAIVLDCHGGPDHTSFATTLLAQHTLLISEPDRITLHGTLNFLRQLRRGTDPGQTDVRLIFNKVVPAFHTRFLQRMYRKLLAREFADRPLLAIFPFEIPLTKAFEETPILSAVFPYSLLAKKTRVMLYDLFAQAHPELLTRQTKTLPNLLRGRYRQSLGKTWGILNESVPLAALVVGAILALVCYLPIDAELRTKRGHLWRLYLIASVERQPNIQIPEYTAQAIAKPLLLMREVTFPLKYAPPFERIVIEFHLTSHVYDLPQLYQARAAFLQSGAATVVATRYPREWIESRKVLEPHDWETILAWLSAAQIPLLILYAVFLLAWLLVAFYLKWTIAIDRRYTRAARLGIWRLSLVQLFLASLIWQLPSYLVGVFLLLSLGPVLGPDYWIGITGLLIVGSPLFAVAIHQVYLVYRDLSYDPHWCESLGRIGFLCTLPLGGVAHYLFWASL